MKEIRLAIAGVGNCASAFVQGLHYYKSTRDIAGLLYPEMGGYRPGDIKVVAAFDVAEGKVGKDVSEAIFAAPNCTDHFYDVPLLKVPVMAGPVLDGVPPHLEGLVTLSKDARQSVDIAKILSDAGAHILVNLLPTGSKEAARAYADAALKEAKIAFINGIPEMIASDPEYAKIAEKNRAPLIGDDFKSQIGTTIINRSLIDLLMNRGVRIDKMYQYNFAGNTDFTNLEKRGESKEVTKVGALKTALPYFDEIRMGFRNMYIACQDDTKTGIIHIQGRNYGGNVVKLDLRVEVDDSANAGGVMVDMIRGAKIAQDRGLGGLIQPLCACYAKHPPVQFQDKEAKEMLDRFIQGDGY